VDAEEGLGEAELRAMHDEMNQTAR